MNQIERLIARWTSHEIKCPPGVAPEVIASFESAHSVWLPPDLRTYFLAVNGMGEREVWDRDFFCFWPLEDVVTVRKYLPDRTEHFPDAKSYFMFADHSVGLPTFAIRLSSDSSEATPVATIFSDRGAFEIKNLFESFTGFVDKYLEDPLGTVILP